VKRRNGGLGGNKEKNHSKKKRSRSELRRSLPQGLNRPPSLEKRVIFAVDKKVQERETTGKRGPRGDQLLQKKTLSQGEERNQGNGATVEPPEYLPGKYSKKRRPRCTYRRETKPEGRGGVRERRN